MKFKMAALRHLGFGDTACVFRKKISYYPKDLPCQRAPLHHDLQSETYYVQLPGLLPETTGGVEGVAITQ